MVPLKDKPDEMSSPFGLSGKVALITGATRGIGLAIAEVFGQAGATVIVSSESAEDCARTEAALRETVTEHDAGNRFVVVQECARPRSALPA
jgi:NAD(P)-dependent dehydrogenase (short-subunit alcohol dehydrogenase family)